ncbi:MAG: hypothetical protein SOW59_09395 [Corynebacterium sp.]|nr:hypothetical protein [Corynebacterium sp.]
MDLIFDQMVLVCAAEVRAVAAAAQICGRYAGEKLKVALVLRHRWWSAVSANELERIAKTDVVAELPTIKSLTKDTEVSGLPTKLPKQLRVVCERILVNAEV